MFGYTRVYPNIHYDRKPAGCAGDMPGLSGNAAGASLMGRE